MFGIFELSWNFIPNLCGNRTLKILKSFIDQVFIEALPHLTGEGETHNLPSWSLQSNVNVAGL